MTKPIIITIRYCSQCKWLLRATWIAQELLQTFETNITSVNLTPDIKGTYQIFINNIKIWDKNHDNGFPEASYIKKKLRSLYFNKLNLKDTKNDIKQS